LRGALGALYPPPANGRSRTTGGAIRSDSGRLFGLDSNRGAAGRAWF
jgi:hypothetical protein